MKRAAQKLMNRKLSRDDGSILQFVVWELPEPLPGSGHRYKYRFYYGREEISLVRYDNERGKGDHRHYGDQEEPYTNFKSRMKSRRRGLRRRRRTTTYVEEPKTSQRR